MTNQPSTDLDEPSPSPVVEAEANVLAQAYMLILSWPCPLCGQPFPCCHDLADDPGAATNAGDESQADFISKPLSALVELTPTPAETVGS